MVLGKGRKEGDNEHEKTLTTFHPTIPYTLCIPDTNLNRPSNSMSLDSVFYLFIFVT